ncbi:MAG: hypothetical protein JKY96_03750 [Phycisphaerales bacterium]|nr:hypothetical protein [Phycisphaerales bacterium]
MQRVSAAIFCLTLISILGGCTSSNTAGHFFNQDLANELIAMEQLDQSLEQMVVNSDPRAREEGFFERKEALHALQSDRCKAIFNDVGYPGVDMVGQQASRAFWLLIQHADADPAFQTRVADAMKPVVLAGNADAVDLAYLTDRVRINTQRPQLYGTQLQYDLNIGRAMPKQIEDPRDVDARRTSVGLEPLWEYMNSVSDLHYQMNLSLYNEKGIDHPWIYPNGFTDW